MSVVPVATPAFVEFSRLAVAFERAAPGASGQLWYRVGLVTIGQRVLVYYCRTLVRELDPQPQLQRICRNTL